jgi:hypothetical protein
VDMIQICYIYIYILSVGIGMPQKMPLMRLRLLMSELVESKLLGLTLDLRFFCSLRPLSMLLDRHECGLVLLWREIGGATRDFSVESFVTAGGGSLGFSDPGLKISKPEPWPRRICGSEDLTSKDTRLDGGCVSNGERLSVVAPSDAGMSGLDGGVS